MTPCGLPSSSDLQIADILDVLAFDKYDLEPQPQTAITSMEMPPIEHQTFSPPLEMQFGTELQELIGNPLLEVAPVQLDTQKRRPPT